MAKTLSPPPIHTPFLNPGGMVSIAWVTWFSQGVTPAIQGIATPYDGNPAMNGVASPGTSDAYSRGNHVHPTDTSRLSTTGTAYDSDRLGGTLASAYALASSIPLKTVSTPLMDGVAAIGSEGRWADGQHVHPTDTSRLSVTGTAADSAKLGGVAASSYALASSVPAKSVLLPLMDGTAALGTEGKWADGQHVHPTDTSRAADNAVVHLTGDEVVAGIKKFGTASNNTHFEADGTMVAEGDATVWKDIVFPIIPKFTGAGNPSFNTFVGNITAPQFAVNDAVQLDANEFPHEWKEGSEIFVHLHWTSMTNVNAARGVKWEVGLTYVDTSGGTSQWVSEQTFTAETTVPANTPALTCFLLNLGSFTPTNAKIGGQIRLRVKRIAAAGTAPATDPFLSQVGLHIQCDTMGSRSVASK